MRCLGLIGGMSWESTATYYRALNEGVRDRVGGLHSAPLLMWSFDFAVIEDCQMRGNWDQATNLMVDAAERLEGAGAEGLMICTNTMHRMADDIVSRVNIPLLHIADATSVGIQQQGCHSPLLLGTRFTMEQAFYKGRLQSQHGIDVVVPNEADRGVVHRIIYEELCQGQVLQTSREAYKGVIDSSVSAGADGVIFGCTEIGLLLSQDDLSVPAFDTTALHVQAGLEFMINE